MEYLTILKILHLVGLIGGVGGAFYTDFLIITRGILRPLTEEVLEQVEQFSRIVTLGLLILWISGTALAVELLATKPEFMANEKFWAKVVIVAVLTLNGVFVHYFVLKEAKKSLKRRLLVDSSISVTLLLVVSGSISFVSWITPFILGKAPEFSYVVPFEIIITLWIVAVLGAIAGVLALVALQEAWIEWKAERYDSRYTEPAE